ncbi:MAG: hypothetical protein B6U89_06050 [Desulfurococcales archaeon ex4484_58]|nr:MAG: hypothetical protein B6U89_06050 [Desulfurococcales archaeon ex4484_58]
MSIVEKKVRALAISDEKDLGDTRNTYYKNIYIYTKRLEKPLVGCYFKEAMVFVREDGIHRIYVKSVRGIRNLYRNDKFIIPIHGSLESIIATDTNIALMIKETLRTKAFLVLKGRDIVYELRELSKGLLTKKKYYLTSMDLGFSGSTILGVGVLTNGKHESKVLIQGSDDSFRMKEYNEIIVLGWSGLWYAYLIPEKEDAKIIVHLATGETKKYTIPLDIIGKNFIKPHTMFYYDHQNHILGLNNGSEVKIIDLDNKVIQWQKIFGLETNTPLHGVVYDRIVIFSDNKVFVVNITNGSIIFEKEYRDKVVSASLSEKYLVVSTTDRIYVYQRRRDLFEEYGKYLIFGSVIGVNACGDDLLITYMTPGNIIKTTYVNFNEKMEIRLKKVSLVTNTGVELPIGDFKWDIRLLEKTSPLLDVIKKGDNIAFIDKGSEPGEYRISFVLSTPNYLPVICDLDVKVEGIKSIIKKIKLISQPEYSEKGVYIPLTIDTTAGIDELYVVLTSRDNSVFASTNVSYNIKKGENTIPLYITWAKSGLHEVELKIIGWSKRNRLYERFNTTIKFERDIPPLYSRIHTDGLYIWSPYDLDNVEIRIRNEHTETALTSSLSKGWNELEPPTTLPEEIIIYLPTKVRCIVRRDKSWIEFLK